MPKEAGEIKFPELVKCSYWGAGLCAETGCAAQALMENSADLGKNAEATARRDKIEKDAKAAGCSVKLVRPTFK
ncbi:MAG TPA: hypothetical protein VFI61_04585 [Patescibacteria group bacterium]|nr:hypothetical protein [Patescibacteria group bacterium]